MMTNQVEEMDRFETVEEALEVLKAEGYQEATIFLPKIFLAEDILFYSFENTLISIDEFLTGLYIEENGCWETEYTVNRTDNGVSVYCLPSIC